jgi:hypothetical protein
MFTSSEDGDGCEGCGSLVLDMNTPQGLFGVTGDPGVTVAGVFGVSGAGVLGNVASAGWAFTGTYTAGAPSFCSQTIRNP